MDEAYNSNLAWELQQDDRERKEAEQRLENKTTFHSEEPPKHAEENVIPLRRNLPSQPYHDAPLRG